MPSPAAPLRLDFAAEIAPAHAETEAGPVEGQRAAQARCSPSIFGDEQDELPPTWSEDSAIFHTWAKCTRLQSIRRNRRITGNPGLRQHCLNCISIAATHRRG